MTMADASQQHDRGDDSQGDGRAAAASPGRRRSLLPIGGMGVMATALPPMGGLVILGTLPVLGPWLEQLGWPGMLLYVVGFVVFAGLAILPTYSQAILGGWAFGPIWGMGAAIAGFAGGAWLAYLLGRCVAQDRLLQVIDQRPRWRAVHRELVHAGFWRASWLVTLVRLPPTAPFALTNVVMASAKVPIGPYLTGTILGLTPRTAMAVFAAAEISRFDSQQSVTSRSNVSILLAVALTLLAVVVIGVAARRALRRVVERDAEARAWGRS